MDVPHSGKAKGLFTEVAKAEAATKEGSVVWLQAVAGLWGMAQDWS